MSVYPSFRPSICSPAWHSSPNWRICFRIYIWILSEYLLRKLKIHWNPTRVARTLREDHYTFWPYLTEFFLEWEMFHTKIVQKLKTLILCSMTFYENSTAFFFLDNVGKYYRAEHATDDNIIRRIRWACWITKATNTHSEYVIIIAFPQQHLLLERALIPR